MFTSTMLRALRVLFADPTASETDFLTQSALAYLDKPSSSEATESLHRS